MNFDVPCRFSFPKGMISKSHGAMECDGGWCFQTNIIFQYLSKSQGSHPCFAGFPHIFLVVGIPKKPTTFGSKRWSRGKPYRTPDCLYLHPKSYPPLINPGLLENSTLSLMVFPLKWPWFGDFPARHV